MALAFSGTLLANLSSRKWMVSIKNSSVYNWDITFLPIQLISLYFSKYLSRIICNQKCYSCYRISLLERKFPYDVVYLIQNQRPCGCEVSLGLFLRCFANNREKSALCHFRRLAESVYSTVRTKLYLLKNCSVPSMIYLVSGS